MPVFVIYYFANNQDYSLIFALILLFKWSIFLYLYIGKLTLISSCYIRRIQPFLLLRYSVQIDSQLRYFAWMSLLYLCRGCRRWAYRWVRGRPLGDPLDGNLKSLLLGCGGILLCTTARRIECGFRLSSDPSILSFCFFSFASFSDLVFVSGELRSHRALTSRRFRLAGPGICCPERCLLRSWLLWLAEAESYRCDPSTLCSACCRRSLSWH